MQSTVARVALALLIVAAVERISAHQFRSRQFRSNEGNLD